MAVPHRSLSQVKLDIQEIISNLEILEKSDCIGHNFKALTTSTEELLRNLENLPLESFNTELKKRQNRRKYKKLQKLRKSRDERKLEIKTVDSKCEEISHAKALNVSHETLKRTDRHIKECQRFLKTFELLQQLHLVRGRNPSETYKFSLKLRQLKSIWNSLLQDKLQEQTSDDVKIQEQWNEVLFGPSEKIYFEEKTNVQDFIRKRQVWDSYVDSKYGSPIPIGWVIPPIKVSKKWQPYMGPGTYYTE